MHETLNRYPSPLQTTHRYVHPNARLLFVLAQTRYIEGRR